MKKTIINLQQKNRKEFEASFALNTGTSFPSDGRPCSIFNLKVILLLVTLFCCARAVASDDPFEVVDDEGNTFGGILVFLDATKIVLEVDGEKKESPLERVAKIRNPGFHPYKRPESNSVAAATMPDRRAANPRGRAISSLLNPKGTSDSGESGREKKTYPDTVTVLELADGTRLVAVDLQLKGKTATCRLLNEKELSIPLEGILSIRLAVKGLPEVETAPSDWLRLATPDRKGDRIVVGQPGSLDIYDGILSTVDETTVSFVIAGETLPVPRRKVYGLVLHAGEVSVRDREPPSGNLSLRDGSLIRFGTLESNGEGNLLWTTRLGISGIVAPGEVDVIDYSRKNAVPLTSLKTVRREQALLFDRENGTVEAVSPQTLLRDFRANRMFAGKDEGGRENSFESMLQVTGRRKGSRENKLPELPLPGLDGVRLDGVSYENALAVPARTVLEYALEEPYSALRGLAGIDDRLRPGGAARLILQADDHLLCELSFHGGEPVRKLDFKLPDGARILRLTVDFSDGAAHPASLGLAEVKLIK